MAGLPRMPEGGLGPPLSRRAVTIVSVWRTRPSVFFALGRRPACGPVYVAPVFPAQPSRNRKAAQHADLCRCRVRLREGKAAQRRVEMCISAGPGAPCAFAAHSSPGDLPRLRIIMHRIFRWRARCWGCCLHASVVLIRSQPGAGGIDAAHSDVQPSLFPRWNPYYFCCAFAADSDSDSDSDG